MRKELIFSLFSVLVILQIATPASMILKRESVLKHGQEFRFKTAPVDPYDAFRGRYVALRIEDNEVIRPAGIKLIPEQKVYAHITVDEYGVAHISSISISRPSAQAYILAKVWYVDGNKVRLSFPIDRYYMEETAAPRAERFYRDHSSQKKQDAYVTVKVKDGFAVVNGLHIGENRIEDMLKNK